MARRNAICIYDKNHNLQISNKNSFAESRNINLSVSDYNDYLQIKARDVSDFVFNYTSQIDLRQFEIMKSEQCLDIDFNEFKTNLIDMLQQVQKHEMFLKCEIDATSGKLIFYGKSRIKSIIFLTIDLQVTSQKEIFDEMNSSIVDLQNMNKNLSSQIQITKRILQEKDSEIEKFGSLNKQLEKRFFDDLQKISCVFAAKLQECSAKLLNKILILTQKLLKLMQDVEIVKAESFLKSDSSARLLQSMENLRLESLETSKLIDELKRENCALKTAQLDNEKTISELNSRLQLQQTRFQELKSERDELEKDVKQATMIIAQKSTANEELARDVIQANQMLVNFNHMFDTKNDEINELKNTVATQDKILQEQSHKFHDLCKEFEAYKAKFNVEHHNKLSQELFHAHKRVEEVEKHNRETTKINELLTKRLAAGDYARRN